MEKFSPKYGGDAPFLFFFSFFFILYQMGHAVTHLLSPKLAQGGHFFSRSLDGEDKNVLLQAALHAGAFAAATSNLTDTLQAGPVFANVYISGRFSFAYFFINRNQLLLNNHRTGQLAHVGRGILRNEVYRQFGEQSILK